MKSGIKPGCDLKPLNTMSQSIPVLEKKEEKAFGEFMSKRKCQEEYDQIEIILDAGGRYAP